MVELRNLLYVRTATPLADGALAAILASSQHNNVSREITGFLLFNQRNFLQLIEGPEASLMSLMNALGRDPRHQGIVQIFGGKIAVRACPDWRMRHIPIAERTNTRAARLRDELPPDLPGQVKDLAINFASLN
jgi:hypothetical protein